jgi:hypothetical protein
MKHERIVSRSSPPHHASHPRAKEDRIMKCVSCFALGCLARSGLFVAACAFGFDSTATAQTLGPLVQVTTGNPLSHCAADHVHSQQTAYGSTLYPNTSIEPWVAVDPTDALRLLVGHQQDRWSDGGARGLVGVVSSDAGSTWSDTIPAGVTRCTDGKEPRASDPWVTFAQDGTAFFFSLAFSPMKSTTPFGARGSSTLVSRSTDHAVTWEAATTLITNNSPHVLNDKNSITADPTMNGLVYAVWDQLSVFPLTSQAAALLAQNDGVVIARAIVKRLRTAAAGGAPVFKFTFTGPTFFSRTTDNGDTWSVAVPIYQPGNNAQTIDNIVEVLPTGDVLNFFTAINVTPSGLSIGYVRSTNRGVSWSEPTFAADIQVAGVISPDSGQPVRDASILYSVAVDPKSGNIYLAWQDARFSATTCTTPTGSIPIDGIVFSQSTDGGNTWSTPVMINKTPANAAHPCRQQAFIPAVVAAGNGTVVVTYYDFRNDTNTPSGFEATDYFSLFCKSNCSSAASWGNEKRLTWTSFNILDAPEAGGHFLGDYMGLAASGGKNVFPVFGIATGSNVTADFTRKITLP